MSNRRYIIPFLDDNINTPNRFHPRSFSLTDDPIIPRSMPPWHTHQEREATRVPVTSFRRFNVDQEPRPPFQVLVLDDRTEREFTHIPQRTTSRYYSRNDHEDSKLTQDEQKIALTKLKKSVYNPTLKRLSKRLSLYYRDNNYNKRKNHDDNNDGEKCTICLEDFEPKEMVMVTPCNHMFHEDCIVPWVKSEGRCPVCRFLFYEPARTGNSSTVNINNIANATANLVENDNILLEDLISIVTAFEHDFLFHNVAR